MSDGLTFTLPPGIIEAIIEQVTERVTERVAEANDRSPWLTAAEAADYLHVPIKTIYNWTSAGCIPHRKIGGRLLFHVGELDAFADRYREGRLR